MQQSDPLNPTKGKPRGAENSSSRPTKSGRQQPRTVRLTVSLPGDLVDRLRDAVYWSPDLKLAWLIAQSLRTSLADLETSRNSPFPKRIMALRAGRPRLVGQSMKVHVPAKPSGDVSAHPPEVRTQAGLISEALLE